MSDLSSEVWVFQRLEGTSVFSIKELVTDSKLPKKIKNNIAFQNDQHSTSVESINPW